MAIFPLYEPQYTPTGWFDDSGYRLPSWWDRDLSSNAVVLVAVLEAPLLLDDDVFYELPPITYEVTASFFDDDDLFFHPMSVRALTPPDLLLKNEVRRVR